MVIASRTGVRWTRNLVAVQLNNSKVARQSLAYSTIQHVTNGVPQAATPRSRSWLLGASLAMGGFAAGVTYNAISPEPTTPSLRPVQFADKAKMLSVRRFLFGISA